MGMGYEYVEAYPLLQEARVAAEEAVATHKAKPAPAGQKTLILHPSNLWLTIHESVGHPDRARSRARLRGQLRRHELPHDRQARQVRVRLEAREHRRRQDAGERAWRPAATTTTASRPTRWHLVKDGTFVDYQTTRDQAHLIGQKASHGCSYADSWGSIPFQRMPNVSLEAGEPRTSARPTSSRATDDGVYVKGDASYSIDHQRYNFQFSGQTFWEVKNGKITTQLRDLAYQSNTPEFWKSCDMLGGKSTYQLGGAFSDGKGQPSQSNSVSHGCPIARFARVNILNTGQ